MDDIQLINIITEIIQNRYVHSLKVSSYNTYIPCLKKTHHPTATIISSNLPIFKILSLLESLLNFQQNSI